MIVNLKKLEKADRQMAWANLCVIVTGGVVVYIGYTVLATMIFLLWIGIVNGLLLLALTRAWIASKKPVNNSTIGLTLQLLIYPLVMPAVMLLAVAWVAHIYNLSLWLNDILSAPFVNMPDKIGVVSIAKLISIYVLGVCVNFHPTMTPKPCVGSYSTVSGI